MKIFFALVISVFLSGCLTLGQKGQMPTFQESLLVKCPKELPTLTDGNADTAALVLRETQSIYHNCAPRHNGLVDAVRKVKR